MITIVSGMARSGTSLTMQMLKAAKFPIYWDREPNIGPANPLGYYEVKGRDWRVYSNIERLLNKLEDHATKVFPRNWDYFTPKHSYRFIYLDRDPVNIRDSQRRMLEVERRKSDKGSPAQHLRAITAYRGRALKLLRDYEHIVVQYEDLYTGHAQWQIADFLSMTIGQENRMLKCVDTGLHHFKPEGK